MVTRAFFMTLQLLALAISVGSLACGPKSGGDDGIDPLDETDDTDPLDETDETDGST